MMCIIIGYESHFQEYPKNGIFIGGYQEYIFV